MLATIRGIQKDEVENVIKEVRKHHGAVTSQRKSSKAEIVSLHISVNNEDQADMDVTVCDLGYAIDWS